MLTIEESVQLSHTMIRNIRALPENMQVTVLAEFLLETGKVLGRRYANAIVESPSPMIKMMGGPFDGSAVPADAINKVVEVPSPLPYATGTKPHRGTLHHYTLSYSHCGRVTKEEAEKIVGKPLE